MSQQFITELSGSLIFRSGSNESSIRPSGTGVSVSGSFNITGSQLTFNGTDVMARIGSLEAGVNTSASLGPLNTHSGSLNTFTGSIQTQVNALQAATSSYLTTTPAGTVSSSAQLPSGIVSSSIQLPSGILSSSTQVTSLGFITDVAAGTISSSAQISTLGYVTSSTAAVSDLNAKTGSYATTGSNHFSGNQFITGHILPQSDGSNNGTYDLGSASDPFRDLYITTASLNFVKDGVVISKLTSVNNGIKIGNLVIGTSSIDFIDSTGSIVSTVASATIDGSGNAININSSTAGTVSSSAQISTLGYLTSASAAATGFGSGGGSYTLTNARVAALEAGIISSSAQLPSNIISSSTQITSLGYLTSTPAGTISSSAQLPSGLVSSSTQLPAGILSSSTQVSTAGFLTSASAASTGFGSGVAVAYNGNRIVSQTNLPGLFSASFNAGTSGSITEFLDKVFFPNTTPSISTGNQVQEEFTASGSSIVTVAATDAEGQALTFGVGAGYTDNFVKVASNGAMTWNALATASMNTTDRGDGNDAHPVIVTATDTFAAVASKTIYITVTPNAAPKFRETSVSGNIITSYAANVSESNGAGEITKIYFSDAESDTITITSQSHASGDFNIVKYSTYVAVNQVTSSLNYEGTQTYNFSVSASDEHYGNGDVDSIVRMPITINVVDNPGPVLNNQSISGVNENSSDGTSAGSVSATDVNGDTITFTSFTLGGLKIDGSSVSTGTYTGGSQLTNPHEDPFQMSSTGVVTRKAGVFLNSDLINSYIYSASVNDAYNVKTSATVTIPVADDTPATLSNNATFYIIESALSGSSVTTATSGIAGTVADYNANQSVTFNVNPTNRFSISSAGNITVNSNISGSAVGGTSITGSVTASNAFATKTHDAFTVSITNNSGPTISATPTTANLNTNGARPSNNLYVLTFSDPEGDNVDLNQFTFSGTNLSSSKAGGQVSVSPTSNLTAGTYNFTASITDVGGFDTVTNKTEFSITQAPTGSLTGSGAFYIIESAVTTNNIVNNVNGRTGNQASASITYSPQFNSAGATAFTSSNSAIAITNAGLLSINVNLSGSATSSGATIASTISYQDQYNNIGSENISVAVTTNHVPTASFTNQTSIYNTNQAVSNANLVSVAITDIESDSPYAITLSGANAASMSAVPTNGISSSWEIRAVNNLPAATYTYNVTVTDNFNKSNSYNGRSFTIAQADDGTLSNNGTYYIIESATSSSNVVTSANGRTGTQGAVSVAYSPNYASQVATSFSSSNALINVHPTSGVLTAAQNISGSSNVSGSTIASTISWTDQYSNTDSTAIAVNVTKNNPPDIVFSDTTANHNTNGARPGNNLTTLSFTDTEDDSIDYTSITLAYGGANLTAVTAGTTRIIRPTANLTANTYVVTASISNNFHTNTEHHSIAVTGSNAGTLGTNGTFYVIESATNYQPVVTNSNGRTGTTGSLSVSYNPQFNSAAVQNYTSSNSAISIGTTGDITLNLNLSGSATGSGATISSNITFQDQYNTIGSGSISIAVTANTAPTVVSFTDVPSNFTASVSAGTNLVSMSIQDTESNTPFSASLSGTDAAKLKFSYNNADSSSAFIQAASTLGAEVIDYNVTVHDSFGKNTSYTGRSLTLVAAQPKTFAYGLSWAANPSSEAQFIATAGDAGADETAVVSGSVVSHFQSGGIGSTFGTSYGAPATLTLIRTASLTDLSDSSNTGTSQLGYFNFSGGAQHVIIIFASSSLVKGKPRSMYDGVPPDSTGTAKEYYTYAKNASIPGTMGSGVYYFDTTDAIDGVSRWGMVFGEGKNTNNSKYYLMPDSASAP